MKGGARTPEELETLLEDAFVVRDGEALIELFENGAVLVSGDVQEARGEQEIARFASAQWDRDRTYVADPRRILQARDTALVVADRGINVARRGSDGTWRYAIAFLSLDRIARREDRYSSRAGGTREEELFFQRHHNEGGKDEAGHDFGEDAGAGGGPQR